MLGGELTRETTVDAVQQAHRNYAKRQMTWFRREPDVNWLHGFGDQPSIISQAVAMVQNASAI
jgi:tRNA dimethylallyltransferase